MRFEEAKVREDYKFITDMLELYIPEIRNNYLHGFTADSSPVFGAAVMEIGFVDIEINIASKAQVNGDMNSDDMTTALDYFCCFKHSNGEWESDNYISDHIDVDWNSENWRELLERDMFETLNKYVSIKKYHYDKGND